MTTRRLHVPALSTSSALPAATAALAAAIFIADTLTRLEIAVGVLHVAVVLMSVGFCRRRGVMLVSAGCMALTLMSFLLTRGGALEAGIINAALSLIAIAATTYLALKIESAEVAASDARAQLAHVARLTVLGELTASIAHEINQPLAAIVTSGNACSRWLAAHPPNVEKAVQAVNRMVADAARASEVIARVRGLATRAPLQKRLLRINDVITEVVSLTRTELSRQDVALRMQLADGLPPVVGDPIQLQQVLLNLIVNAMEAVAGLPDAAREITIGTAADEARGIVVEVGDSGVGFEPGAVDHVFDAFYTTKQGGMGMGLAISRSIIEAHGGSIAARVDAPRGATVSFSLPAVEEKSDDET